jgi:hypothetical protein
MKYLMKYVVLIVLLALISACCKKTKCFVPSINMKLYNFRMDQVDSIIVYKYEKGNNFISALDSTYLSAVLSNDKEFYVAYSNIENPSFDYLVKIKGLTKEYRVTDMRTVRSKCKSCGPFTSKRNYFTILADYQLNGQLKDDFVIEVYK